MQCKRTLVASLTLFLLGGTLAADAMAGEMPKRKPGLWEIKTHMDGMPGGQVMQMCIDQSSDNLLQQQAKEKADCSTMDIKTSGGNTTIHAVCRAEKSTVTMDGTYQGSFQTSYKGDMKMRYSPPLHGMSETHMTQEARWLGACKPGQKPGDVIMPNMGNINVNEMMKDPRIREMMKQQH